MAGALVTKTIGDGNGGSFAARFFSPDGTGTDALLAAHINVDHTGTAVLDETQASLVSQSGGWNVGLAGRSYETVAASQTAQAMGATGATGDVLDGLLVIPATTSPGAVSIADGAGSAITVFAGGASSVSNLVPFFVPVGAASTSGAWKVTTGANVSAVGVGKFS